MREIRSLTVPFFVAAAMAPIVIVLHECGHWIAAYLLDLAPAFHWVRVVVAQQPTTDTGRFLFTAAGPVVEMAGAAMGCLYLWRIGGDASTKGRITTWIATCAACLTLRWVVHAPGVLHHDWKEAKYTSDEARISQLIGWPGWLLPWILFIPGSLVLAWAIVKHPQGHRLMPFLAMLLGALTGAYLLFFAADQ